MFSLAKVRFVKIAILFTSLILCLLLPREHRRNSDSTSCQQKVLFVNICHLHWLYSARGYPRDSLPVTLVYLVLPSHLAVLCSRFRPREFLQLLRVCLLSRIYSGLLRFPLRSHPVTPVYLVLPFLLAVLLCGVPEKACFLGCISRLSPRVNPRLSLFVIPNYSGILFMFYPSACTPSYSPYSDLFSTPHLSCLCQWSGKYPFLISFT